MRDDVALANCYRPAGAEHASARHNAVAGRRRQKIDLELDAQDRGVHRHEGQRRVAARAVGRRGQHPGVKEPVLLHEVVAHVDIDVDFAGGNAAQARTDGGHESLSVKARANAAIVRGVLRHGHRHAGWRQAVQTGSDPKSTISRRTHEPCRCRAQRTRRQRTQAPPETRSKRWPQTSHSVAISECMKIRKGRITPRCATRVRSRTLAPARRMHSGYGPHDDRRATGLASGGVLHGRR